MSDVKNPEVKMDRTVGLLGGVSLNVGLMIGSGIFVSAKTVARLTGSVGMYLMTWVITGTIAFLGALSYAELGTMIPISGGEYSYLKMAFGPVYAFLNSWVTIFLLKPSGLAAIVLACGYYIIEPFYPALNDCIPELVSKEQLSKIIAAFVLGEFKICFLLLSSICCRIRSMPNVMYIKGNKRSKTPS